MYSNTRATFFLSKIDSKFLFLFCTYLLGKFLFFGVFYGSFSWGNQKCWKTNTLVTTNSHTNKLSDNKLLVPGNRTNLVEKVFFYFHYKSTKWHTSSFTTKILFSLSGGIFISINSFSYFAVTDCRIIGSKALQGFSVWRGKNSSLCFGKSLKLSFSPRES